MRKSILAVLMLPALALPLAGCPSASQPTKAAQVEQAFTLADTAWLAYLRLPDCAMNPPPLCSDTAIIAKGAPVELAAYTAVENYQAASNDPNQPADTLSKLAADASAAIAAFNQIVSALPKKGQ